MTVQNTVDLTYGQKAVGLTFNPSSDPNVHRIKELYAEIIDQMNIMRDMVFSVDTESKRLYSIAITEAQTAQMWAVKAITWQK